MSKESILPHSQLAQSRALALLGLAGTSLFWAGNALVARAMAGAVPPFSLSFWRWVISFLLLSPFIYLSVRRHFPTLRAHLPKLLVLALLSVTSFNSLLYLAAQATTAINITLVNATTPLVTLLIAIALIRHRPRLPEMIGIAIALAGTLWLLSRGEFSSLLELHFQRGDLIMLIGVVTWSLYSVLLRRWSLPIPTFALFCLLVLLGTPMILPLYLWEYQNQGGFALSLPVLLALGYIGLFPSIAAYLLWNHGVQVVGPAQATVFSYLTPLLTACLAIPLLGESLQAYHLAGGLLILGGLTLANRFRRT